MSSLQQLLGGSRPLRITLGQMYRAGNKSVLAADSGISTITATSQTVTVFVGSVKTENTGCQACQLDYCIHPAPKSKQGDICVKPFRQSVACSVVYRQVIRQGSPPPSLKASEVCTSQAMKSLHRGHCGPWLFTYVKHAADERMQAGCATHFASLI